jgi:outer membrane autotransporter protein
MAYSPTTNLGSYGQTENQQRTGDAVQTVCGQFVAFGTNTAEEKDLFDRCGNMVSNANQLTGTDSTTKSLGLDADGLAAAVQTVATEEFSSTKTTGVELSNQQVSTGVARLQTIRSGIQFGVSSNLFRPFDPFAVTDSSDNDKFSGAVGGAAGDANIGKWGGFLNVNAGFGDRDDSDYEDAFEYDNWGITSGADYRLSDNFVIGALLSYQSIDSDFDVTTAVPGGGLDADSWGLGVYETYYTGNFYIDGLVSYAHVDYDLNRRILLPTGTNPGSDPAVETTDRTANSDTDSNNWTLSIGGGLDLANGSLTYGPYTQLTYQLNEVDGYAESGASGLNLTVDGQDWESLTSVIGGRIGYTTSQSWGVLMPQANFGWVHEFMNDSEEITAFYSHDPRRNPLVALTDDPDRNYFELGAGVSAVMRGGLQAFFNYQTLLGHQYITDHSFTVGVRGEF